MAAHYIREVSMPLRMDSPMPSLQGGTNWFNSQPVSKEDLAGHPALIHFWAISCGTCKESLPDVKRWLNEYGAQGFKVISVHMPRQESDTNVESVKEAIAEYGVPNRVLWTTGTKLRMLLNNYVPAFFFLIVTAN